jgi:hypothetical protein
MSGQERIPKVSTVSDEKTVPSYATPPPISTTESAPRQTSRPEGRIVERHNRGKGRCRVRDRPRILREREAQRHRENRNSILFTAVCNVKRKPVDGRSIAQEIACNMFPLRYRIAARYRYVYSIQLMAVLDIAVVYPATRPIFSITANGKGGVRASEGTRKDPKQGSSQVFNHGNRRYPCRKDCWF